VPGRRLPSTGITGLLIVGSPSTLARYGLPRERGLLHGLRSLRELRRAWSLVE